jgi:integrase
LINLLLGFKQSLVKPYKKTNDVIELNKSNDNIIEDNPIFTYNPHSFTKKFSKIINDPEKKLPKIRFHDLRHYHASLLYKNNVPDLYAAERLGHDISVLKKIYQHLGLEEKKDLDNKVKNLFNQG